MQRLTDRRAILCALDDAIQWQQGFRDANLGFDAEQVAEADKMILAYRRVYGRMTGGRATLREMCMMADMKDSEALSVTKIQRPIEPGGIKPNPIKKEQD